MTDRLGFLFDATAIRWLQDLFGTDFPLPLEVISALGDSWGILLAIGIAFWLFDRSTAYTVAAAAVVATPVWLALSSLFSVERPSGSGFVVFETLEVGAFPSGHVFHAMVTWGALAARSRFPWWAVGVIGVAVGIARIYMGVHFPADVLASLVLGPLFVWGFVRVWDRVRRIDFGDSEKPAWIALGALVLFLAGLTVALLGPLDPALLRRWEIVGIVYGGPIAVFIQQAWSRVADARLQGNAPLVVGVLGLTALGVTARTLGQDVIWLGGLATALALLWTFVAVPALVGGGRDDYLGGARSGSGTEAG